MICNIERDDPYTKIDIYENHDSLNIDVGNDQTVINISGLDGYTTVIIPTNEMKKIVNAISEKIF